MWWPAWERGSAPLELVLGVGVILLPLALLSLSFGPLLQRAVLAQIAAAEAARELVLSDGSEKRALALVGEIARNHQIPGEQVRVGFCGGEAGPPEAALRSACPSPAKGALVTVTVVVKSPALLTPYGKLGEITISASHTEMVGLYRSTR